MTDPPRTSLLAQPWVQSLAIALLAIVAFGSNLEGLLIWDDPLVIGPAAALNGPLQAFRSDLFATGSAAGAVYYRPLVTITYWLDVRVFSAAPHVGMHLVNLAWHVVASILVLRALRRWVGGTPGDRAGVAAFAAAAFWAVMPMKAENVAWISGRGDVMGLVFGLAGLELAARATTRGGRAAAMAAATALAVLCKESMVALPLVVAGAALADARAAASAPGLRAHVLAAIRDPRTVGSGAVAATYLALRMLLLPIASGGQGMLAPVGRLDLLRLFLETTGAAAIAVLSPWNAELLRSPIAFRGPTDLVALPGLALLGAAVWIGAGWTFVRHPTSRAPLTVGLGAFLPVSNLVPMGLEARVSDRFLYVPTVGLALGLAVAATALAPRRADRMLVAAACIATALLAFAASRRAALFASNHALFAWEVRNGDGALAVYNNAAAAAVAEHRYREARDLRLGELRRFHELGFSGEGFPQLYEAIRMQVLATGDSHPPSLAALERLSRALLEGRAETIEAPLEEGTLTIDTSSPAAREFAAAWPDRITVTLALILARRGDLEPAMALAERAVERCSRCNAVRLTASEVAAAALRPDRAAAWLEPLPWWEENRAAQARVVEVQHTLLAQPATDTRRLAAFVGGAYPAACAGGDPIRPPFRHAVAAACILAASPDAAAKLLGRPVDDRVLLEVQPLRWDAAARAEVAAAASTEGRPE